MNRFLSIVISALPIMALASNDPTPDQSKWRLAWEENFDGTQIDSTAWSKCTRGNPDWQNTQSPDPRLYEVSDGTLKLRGIVNDDTTKDPAPYLTGGIWTKDKKSFDPGRFEIRAKLHGAKGAWPAIWLLPYDHKNNMWPNGGEIDIMERLNNNHGAYQTVHSHYTYDLGRTANPQSTGIYPINREEFNVYGVEMYPDKIVFMINGEPTLTYPKVNDGAEGQFPFYIPQYLLIDMQLGGQWVGDVDPADLPVEMEIDWVRYYEPVK